MLHRIATIGYFAAPVLLGLALYWPGLASWFQKDDFSLLRLRDLVHSWRDFRWVLFAPIAQGTIRTLSERVFFLSFTTIFGIHALPFRCFAFLTFAATLPLLRSVCVRLTGSRAAGFWATILWTVNSGLAVALSWTAVYYELLCAFFFLLNFWLLLRYVETGRRCFYWAQCATFLAGFGVLELNVVYPALATVYALCCARRIVLQIVPWFAASAAYTTAHLAVASLPASGLYKLHWDAGILSTLFTYWKWAVGPSQLRWVNIYPSPFRSALTVFLTLGLIGFLLWKLRTRQWVAAFFPAWFVIALAPLLPLRDQMNDSYLPVPLIGLAMWGAWSLVTGWSAGVAGKIVAVSLLGIYLCVSVPVTRAITLSFYQRSQEIRRMVLGVAAEVRAKPEKTVFLKGVDTEMFWSGLYGRPFRLFGFREVYLVAEDEQRITLGSQLGDARSFFADPVAMRNALDSGQALVLDLSGGKIRDITDVYRATADN